MWVWTQRKVTLKIAPCQLGYFPSPAPPTFIVYQVSLIRLYTPCAHTPPPHLSLLLDNYPPSLIMSTYLSVSALYPVLDWSAETTFSTTMEGSFPAFLAMVEQGARRALRTMSTPDSWSGLSTGMFSRDLMHLNHRGKGVEKEGGGYSQNSDGYLWLVLSAIFYNPWQDHKRRILYAWAPPIMYK